MENDCKKPAKIKCIYTIRGKCIIQSKLKKKPNNTVDTVNMTVKLTVL